jgi:hypothetical protein
MRVSVEFDPSDIYPTVSFKAHRRQVDGLQFNCIELDSICQII